MYSIHLWPKGTSLSPTTVIHARAVKHKIRIHLHGSNRRAQRVDCCRLCLEEHGFFTQIRDLCREILRNPKPREQSEGLHVIKAIILRLNNFGTQCVSDKDNVETHVGPNKHHATRDRFLEIHSANYDSTAKGKDLICRALVNA